MKKSYGTFDCKKVKFSQIIVDDTMKDESPTLSYGVMLMGCGPNAFTQFIDILIETKVMLLWIWF